MLEVSPAAIKKWIRQGKLAAFRTPGGHFRVLAGSSSGGAGEPLRVLVVDDQRDVAEVKVVVMTAYGLLARLLAARR